VSAEPLGVNIKILDKDYRIACQPEEQDELLASARLLDARMREIRQAGRVIGSDRIAVLAALNIAHDLIRLQKARGGEDSDTVRRLRRLEERVTEAVSAETHLDAPAERV
jgi:cell division protein ZapA